MQLKKKKSSTIRRKIEEVKKLKFPRIKIPKFSIQNVISKKILRLGGIVLAGLIVVYIFVGIGFAVAIYKNHSDSTKIHWAVKAYPFPVAWTDNQPIWAKDFYRHLNYIKSFYQKSEQALPEEKDLWDQVTKQLIDQTIIARQAKKQKIKLSHEEIEAVYGKLVEQQGGEEDVKKVLKNVYNMTGEELKTLIKDQLISEKLQNSLAESLIHIKVHNILITDEKLAKEVLDKVKNGEDFSELAKKYSQDEKSKDIGGELDWIYRETMVKEFEDVVFTLAVGSYTQDLVKTDLGFHIIKVDERKGEIDKSFNQWFNDLKIEFKTFNWIKCEDGEKKGLRKFFSDFCKVKSS